MKKKIYILLSAVILTAFLSACGQDADPDVDKESGTATAVYENDASDAAEDIYFEPEPESDPEQPNLMTKYGFKRMAMNVDYTYVTPCANNPKYETDAKVRCTEYTRTDLGDGYESIHVVFHYTYVDDNAYKYGGKWFADTVNSCNYEPGFDLNELDSNVTGDSTFSMEFNGQTYDDCYPGFECINYDWEKHEAGTDIVFTYKLPKGFKGFTVWTTYGPEGKEAASEVEHDLTTSKYPVYYFRCD